MAKKAKRGKRMTKGRGWKIEATKGKERSFKGTLLWSRNFGPARIAVFSVPKQFG